jgi:hypothetical protein
MVKHREGKKSKRMSSGERNNNIQARKSSELYPSLSIKHCHRVIQVTRCLDRVIHIFKFPRL